MKSSGLILFFKLSTVGFNYVFILGLSNLFGAAEVGYFALSFTIVQMMSIIARSGMEIGIFKEIAGSANSRFVIRKLRNKSFLLLTSLSIFIVILFNLFESAIATYLLESKKMAMYINAFLIALPFYSIMYFNSEIHRAEKRFSYYAFFQNFGIYFLLCLFLLVKIFYKDLGFDIISFVFVCSVVIFSLLSFIKTGDIKGSDSGNSEISFKLFFYNSISIGITTLAFFLMKWLDGVVLALFYDEETVGIYAVAMRVAILGSFVLLSVNSAIGPRISELNTKGEHDLMITEVRKTTKMGFILTLPVIILTIAFPEFFLGLFGEKFRIAVMPLLIVLLGQIVNTIAGPTGIVLQLSGYQKIFKNIVLVTVLVNLLLNFFLIPNYGIIGAAIVNTASILIWNVWSTLVVKQKFGKTFMYIPFIK